jgi:hypothetical protein
MAIAAVDRETEVTYIRRERDWAARAAAEGRFVDRARLLPVLPATIAGIPGNGNVLAHGNGHGLAHGDGRAHGNGHHGGTAVAPASHE